MKASERTITDDGTLRAIIGTNEQRALQERADASAQKFAETLRKLTDMQKNCDGREVS